MDQASRSVAITPTRHSSIKNLKAWILGWLPVGVGFAAWVASAYGAPEWIGFFKILGIFTAIAVFTVVHELAHFVVGRHLGLKPWCVRIGHGDIVFDKEFHSFRLILQSLPYSGAVYPYLRGERSDRLAMIWAGPLSNAVILMILLPGFLRSTEVTEFTSMSMQVVLANAYLLIATAVPRQTSTGPNDAMMIIHLLGGPRPKLEKSTLDLRPSWSWIVNNDSPEYLLVRYREYLNHSALSAEDRCILLDAFATCVLMAGTVDFLREADQYSEELLRLKSEDLSVQGTRGAVLVEKGDLPRGIEMLEKVMANDTNGFDRVISSSYLALAKWKQGDQAEAHRWLALAREIDADCPATHRIAALITSKIAS